MKEQDNWEAHMDTKAAFVGVGIVSNGCMGGGLRIHNYWIVG